MTIGGQGPYGPPWPPPGNPYGPAGPYPPHGPPPHGGRPPSGPFPPYGRAPHHPHPYGPYGPPSPRPSLWRRFREEEWPTLRELLGIIRRIPGCIWGLVLCCGWPFLVLLLTYPLARSARRASLRVFPVDRARRLLDPDLVLLQKVRAGLALAASFAILAVWGTSEDWADAQDQFTLRLMTTPWLLLLTAPLVLAVLFRFAPPAARPGMWSRLRPARRAVLCYFGAFTAVPALLLAMFALYREFPGSVPVGLLVVALLAPVLWLVFFVVLSSPTAVRTAFHTTQVHAALPALLTGVLVWEFAALNLAIAELPPGPPLVQVGALLGGPASVTALAWWEIRRLRTRFGVSLRG
ncbi:hypothetical protein [Streptomyces sp. NPDC051310]|uniref:hypothetical protein n=1 Tax=Streptomyces sp. NPDC051310 TaxID=3365649 RepID=UPI0037A5343C